MRQLNLSSWTNERLLEDFRIFCVVVEENPGDLGAESHLFALREELLRRLGDNE